MQITQSFTIPFRLPSLNDYIDACRRNKYAGAEMKRKTEETIGLFTAKLLPIQKPVTIRFCWFEGKRNRDPDNVAFAKKFILDTLVKRGKLINDTHKYVKGFEDKFIFINLDMVTVIIEEEE